MEPITFSGSVTKVTPDGRSAIVTLDRPVSGRRFAVISPDTQGRLALMDGDGRIQAGQRVGGKGVPGPESIRAATVRPESSPA